jgi:hypothetical protein
MASVCARICENCEMAATRQLDHTATPRRRIHDRSGRRIVGEARITDCIGKSQQIVGAGFGLLLDREPDHFPTSRR